MFLCRDVIGKCVAPILIGVQPPTINNDLPMYQFAEKVLLLIL